MASPLGLLLLGLLVGLLRVGLLRVGLLRVGPLRADVLGDGVERPAVVAESTRQLRPLDRGPRVLRDVPAPAEGLDRWGQDAPANPVPERHLGDTARLGDLGSERKRPARFRHPTRHGRQFRPKDRCTRSLFHLAILFGLFIFKS
jgi:hypothetical protein